MISFQKNSLIYSNFEPSKKEKQLWKWNRTWTNPGFGTREPCPSDKTTDRPTRPTNFIPAYPGTFSSRSFILSQPTQLSPFIYLPPWHIPSLPSPLFVPRKILSPIQICNFLSLSVLHSNLLVSQLVLHFYYSNESYFARPTIIVYDIFHMYDSLSLLLAMFVMWYGVELTVTCSAKCHILDWVGINAFLKPMPQGPS